MRRILARLVVALLAAPASMTLASAPEPEDVPEAPAGSFVLHGDATRGAELFAERCALCHGPEGRGDGRIRTDPPPRDLTDPRARVAHGDWQTYLVIRDGGPAVGLSKKMFGWGRMLDEQELQDLATFVGSLIETKEAE